MVGKDALKKATNTMIKRVICGRNIEHLFSKYVNLRRTIGNFENRTKTMELKEENYAMDTQIVLKKIREVYPSLYSR